MKFSFEKGVVFNLPDGKYEFGEEEGFCDSIDTVIKPVRFNEEYGEDLLYYIKVGGCYASDGDVIAAQARERTFDFTFLNEILHTSPNSLIQAHSSTLEFYLELQNRNADALVITVDFVPRDRCREMFSMLYEIWSGIEINGRRVSCGRLTAEDLAEKYIKAEGEYSQKEEEKRRKESEKALAKGMESIKAHIAEYSSQFTFDLPDGYKLIWKEHDDGSKTGEIITGIGIHDDGREDYQTAVVLDDVTFVSGQAGERGAAGALLSLIMSVPGSRHRIICSDPPAVFFITDRKVSFLGNEMKVVDEDIFICYAPRQMFKLHYADSLENVRKDKTAYIRKLIDVAGMLRISGKSLQMQGIDCGRLAQEMILDDFEAETVGAVGMRVVVDGKDVLGDNRAKKMDKTIEDLHDRYTCAGKQVSFAVLQRDNPDIDWADLEDYIKARYNLDAEAYFSAEGMIRKTEGNAAIMVAVRSRRLSENRKTRPMIPSLESMRRRAVKLQRLLCDLRDGKLIAFLKDGRIAATPIYGFDVSDWSGIVDITRNIELAHLIGLKNDGTLVCTGENENGACDVSEWTDIISVATGYNGTLGLKLDGTAVCTLDSFCESYWNDVVSIYSVPWNDFLGVKADGEAVYYNTQYGSQRVQDSKWNDLVKVSTGYHHLVGVKQDGTVVAVGENSYGQCDVNEWRDIIDVSASYYHTAGLRADGTVIVTGENDDGRCNTQDWKDIVEIDTSYHNTVGLRADGTVVVAGDNEDGQCNTEDWNNIVAVSSGDGVTLGLKTDGTVVAAGGSAWEENKVEDWTDVVSILAGMCASFGIRKDGTVLSLGYEDYDHETIRRWKLFDSIEEVE